MIFFFLFIENYLVKRLDPLNMHIIERLKKKNFIITFKYYYFFIKKIIELN